MAPKTDYSSLYNLMTSLLSYSRLAPISLSNYVSIMCPGFLQKLCKIPNYCSKQFSMFSKNYFYGTTSMTNSTVYVLYIKTPIIINERQ